jgi:tetratricopeptide (TPR) repeat protein
MRLVAIIVVMLLSLVAIPTNATHAADAAKERKIIDDFLAACRNNPQIAADVRQKVVDAVTLLRDDEDSRSMAVTEGLAKIHPEFQAALVQLAQEELAPAITTLTGLSGSNDPFVAAEASFYLARAYTLQDRYEQALPLLESVTGKLADKSLQTGEATFLLGVAQSRLLKRQEAIASLTKYVNENPNAPERMRIGAWRQVEQLKQVEEGTLTDVVERMDYAGRRLSLDQSGKATQEQQEKIVELLAKLIKDAEEREAQGQGSGQGQEQQQGGSQADGQGNEGDGRNNPTPTEAVRRTYRGGPQSPWSHLRDKQRDPAFSAIQEKFPARYQQLIEQYYKSFQDEGK